jgi:hypothetical protein
MNDRELLEAAAKAAGNGAEWYSSIGMGIDKGQWIPKLWNPLEDDGDAFRLMVELCISVSFGAEFVDAITDGGGYCATEHLGKDPLKAARRAVVEAAANSEGAE